MTGVSLFTAAVVEQGLTSSLGSSSRRDRGSGLPGAHHGDQDGHSGYSIGREAAILNVCPC
jgi:hypothetical protein